MIRFRYISDNTYISIKTFKPVIINSFIAPNNNNKFFLNNITGMSRQDTAMLTKKVEGYAGREC